MSNINLFKSSFSPVRLTSTKFDTSIFDQTMITENKMFLFDGGNQVQVKVLNHEELAQIMIDKCILKSLPGLFGFDSQGPLDPHTYTAKSNKTIENKNHIFSFLRVDMSLGGKIDWHTDNHKEVYKGNTYLIPLHNSKSYLEIMVGPMNIVSVKLEKGSPIIFNQNVPHRVVSTEKNVEFFFSFQVDDSTIESNNENTETIGSDDQTFRSIDSSSEFLELQQRVRESIENLVSCIQMIQNEDQNQNNDIQLIMREIISLNESLCVKT